MSRNWYNFVTIVSPKGENYEVFALQYPLRSAPDHFCGPTTFMNFDGVDTLDEELIKDLMQITGVVSFDILEDGKGQVFYSTPNPLAIKKCSTTDETAAWAPRDDVRDAFLSHHEGFIRKDDPAPRMSAVPTYT